MATFHFDLVSPERLLFSGEVDQVDIPGSEGDFGLLAGPAPLVSSLRPGIMIVTVNGEQERMVVLGGFAEVAPGGALTGIADFADSFGDFDRDILAQRIAAQEEKIKGMSAGSGLDSAIRQLDNFRKVDQHIPGTGMH